MQWETRKHWFWGLFLPGRWYLLFLILGGLCVLTFKLSGLIVAGVLIIFSLLGLSDIWIRWRSFSLSISPAKKAILERNGIVVIAERRININIIGSLTFQQTFMGRIFDYGYLSIGALGGTYQWDYLGQFHILRRVIESQGEWTPRRGPTLFFVISNWASLATRSILQSLHNMFQLISNLWQESKKWSQQPMTPGYARFLQFAEKTVFSRATRRYQSTVSLYDLQEKAFTQDEIKTYTGILKDRKIIVSDLNGKQQRHKRIRTINDIKKNIPENWFHKVI